MKHQSFREWSREKTPNVILENARSMRKEPTDAEDLLWSNLRNRKLRNHKFRRQQPFEGFILDFYCEECHLGVEVDGEIHQTPEQRTYDKLRDEYLEEFGIRIIRVKNEEVLNDIRSVHTKILAAISTPSPLPLSPGRGVAAGRGEGVQSGEAASDSIVPNGNSNETLKYFRFTGLLQREDWLSPAYVCVDEHGLIQYLSNQPHPDGSAIEAVTGYAIPGFQNAHSHAFQYGMAGLAENHPAGMEDDFWSWREEMYKCALLVGPQEAESIAAMLYAEMLRHGYTHVAEFHYLHHDKDGKHYAHLAEMGERMVAAAKAAGIKITLVPVFYQKSNFGQNPQPRQRRFISKTVEDYFKLLEASGASVKSYDHARLAMSIHSLRAVDFADIKRVVEQAPKNLPIHMHVAEQKKEVEECMAFCGQRPMQWLLENLPLNDRFHLVHATHLDDNELNKLSFSGAHIVLCPSTEGNLGDGIFRMKEFYESGGHWSIGTDSHIGLNPWEEFRMIDYRQRLVTNKRNTFRDDAGKYLICEAWASGRSAMGISATDHFTPGQPLDALVIDAASPLINATSLHNLIATLVYTGDSSCHFGTLVNGHWVVKHQHHHDFIRIRQKFLSAMIHLKNR